MSLGVPAAGHPARKRQSSQATKMVSSPAISAVGSAPARMFPGSVDAEIDVIVKALPNFAPPFVEIVYPSAVEKALSSGTTTLPFFSTSGCPPMTPARGTLDAVQV